MPHAPPPTTATPSLADITPRYHAPDLVSRRSGVDRAAPSPRTRCPRASSASVPLSLCMRFGLLRRRSYAFLPLAFAPLVALHCGNGVAPHPYNPGTSVLSSEDAGLPPLYTFKPAGCPYTVSIPQTRPFTNFSADVTTAPSDPTTAVPVRVRVGLGGGTTKPVAGDAGTAAEPRPTMPIRRRPRASSGRRRARRRTPSVRYRHVARFVHERRRAGSSTCDPPPTSGFGTTDPPGYFQRSTSAGSPRHDVLLPSRRGRGGERDSGARPSRSRPFPRPGADHRRRLRRRARHRRDLADGEPAHGRERGEPDPHQRRHRRHRGGRVALPGSGSTRIWQSPADAGTGFITLGQFIMVPIAGNHENDSSQFFANFPIPGAGPYAERTRRSTSATRTSFMIDDRR